MDFLKISLKIQAWKFDGPCKFFGEVIFLLLEESMLGGLTAFPKISIP